MITPRRQHKVLQKPYGRALDRLEALRPDDALIIRQFVSATNAEAAEARVRLTAALAELERLKETS